VVKSGDSLWEIARANNLSTQAIARYNQLTENAYLQPGQVIKIPYDQET
jgi:membrane-bound lytic murein transglycosylase D